MSSNQTAMEVDEDEEYEIPDEIEDVIGKWAKNNLSRK